MTSPLLFFSQGPKPGNRLSHLAHQKTSVGSRCDPANGREADSASEESRRSLRRSGRVQRVARAAHVEDADEVGGF
jgi:hypothetical protein